MYKNETRLKKNIVGEGTAQRSKPLCFTQKEPQGLAGVMMYLWVYECSVNAQASVYVISCQSGE